MKKNIIYRSLLVVFISLCLLAFIGCAEKKSVVTPDTTKETAAAPAPAPEPVKQPETPVPGGLAAQKDTSAEKSVDLEKNAGQASPVLDINFDFDSISIRPDAREILRANAVYFKNHRLSSVVIEGHCDERGTAEYNMALGERRAQETKKYLMNLGVKDSLMKTVSYGKERPLVDEPNEEAWAKNRRAHFVVNP